MQFRLVPVRPSTERSSFLPAGEAERRSLSNMDTFEEDSGYDIKSRKGAGSGYL